MTSNHVEWIEPNPSGQNFGQSSDLQYELAIIIYQPSRLLSIVPYRPTTNTTSLHLLKFRRWPAGHVGKIYDSIEQIMDTTTVGDIERVPVSRLRCLAEHAASVQLLRPFRHSSREVVWTVTTLHFLI